MRRWYYRLRKALLPASGPKQLRPIASQLRTIVLPRTIAAAGLLIAAVLSLAGWRAPQSAAGETAAAHLGRGYDDLKQDRYDAAADEFRAALKLDPTLTLRARFPLAVALFELKQFDDARQQLEAVRREAGDHPNVLYYIGRVNLEQRDFTQAIANLSRAAADPPFPDTTYFLGYACFKQGDLASA